MRKRFEWKIGGGAIQLGDRTLIMGILNVTPDSFSDGGKYQDPDRAYARALELEDQGADIIDIGAESTRPGSQRVTEHQEIERLIPVLKRLHGKLNIPISIDTYKPGVAELALKHGAEIINDPSGLTWEPELAKVAVKYNAGLILNHMRGRPENWAKLPSIPDVTGAVIAELESAVHRAIRAGVEKERIVVDPGLGFGKRKEQNAELLAQLATFARLHLPLLVGPSRKSFLAQATERDTSFANAAAVALAIMGGAHIVRVHEVKEMRIAAQLADTVLAAIPSPDEAPPQRERREEGHDRGNRPVRPQLAERPPKPAPEEPPRPVRPPAAPRDLPPNVRPPRTEGGDASRPPRPPRFDRGGPPRSDRPARFDRGGPRRPSSGPRPPRRDRD